MDFGTSYTRGAQLKPCAICSKDVELADKIVVEREQIHKSCFKCGYCGCDLKQGSCAMFKSVYGLRWFCSGPGSKQCSLKNRAEKEAKLKERGAKLVASSN